MATDTWCRCANGTSRRAIAIVNGELTVVTPERLDLAERHVDLLIGERVVAGERAGVHRQPGGRQLAAHLFERLAGVCSRHARSSPRATLLVAATCSGVRTIRRGYAADPPMTGATLGGAGSRFAKASSMCVARTACSARITSSRLSRPVDARQIAEARGGDAERQLGGGQPDRPETAASGRPAIKAPPNSRRESLLRG